MAKPIFGKKASLVGDALNAAIAGGLTGIGTGVLGPVLGAGAGGVVARLVIKDRFVGRVVMINAIQDSVQLMFMGGGK